MNELRYFDPKQEFTVAWKTLPHWAQAGTVCFITWRTADSLPIAVQKKITAERRVLLFKAGLNPDEDWKRRLEALSAKNRGRIQWKLFTAWDRQLDKSLGECVLARPEVSHVVEQSLKHFNGDRYLLTDSVIMPNHVHVLVAFRDEEMLIKQCTSWKRYTACRINELVGLTGDFWQPEQFDHLVRSPEQFEHYRRYIAENPIKANLPFAAYRVYSKAL
jgi:type I restriction enzyme R subunit